MTDAKILDSGDTELIDFGHGKEAYVFRDQGRVSVLSKQGNLVNRVSLDLDELEDILESIYDE